MSILNFRRYSRVPVELPIRITQSGDSRPDSAYLNNISEEGASLICPSSVPLATLLEFEVQLQPEKDPIQIQAEVLWSRPVKEYGRDLFAHGLMFRRLQIQDRGRLHEFVNGTMSY